MKIALPTKGHKGMRETISEVFSRAETLTIVDMIEKKSPVVDILVNKAAGLSQGAGPLVVKTLKERSVDVVLSSELGPGASTLLETVGIKTIRVKSGLTVSQAIEQFFTRVRS